MKKLHSLKSHCFTLMMRLCARMRKRDSLRWTKKKWTSKCILVSTRLTNTYTHTHMRIENLHTFVHSSHLIGCSGLFWFCVFVLLAFFCSCFDFVRLWLILYVPSFCCCCGMSVYFNSARYERTIHSFDHACKQRHTHTQTHTNRHTDIENMMFTICTMKSTTTKTAATAAKRARQIYLLC